MPEAREVPGTVEVVDGAQVAQAPWRNGAGVTRELLTWSCPDGGGEVALLSLADLTTDGPFSTFPGVDRTHLPLTGGYALIVDGLPFAALARQPVRFPGEAEVVLTGLGRPGRALNLMTRRDHGGGDLVVVRHRGTVTWPERVRAVVLLAGEARTAEGARLPPLGVAVADGPLTLHTHDAVVVEVHLSR